MNDKQAETPPITLGHLNRNRLTDPNMAPKTLLPRVPTVAETLKHPAYATAIWQLQPDRSGFVPVAEGRGGPLNISWEMHGVGPIKLMVCYVLHTLTSHPLSHSPLLPSC